MIKKLRVARGLTQAQLAERVGTARSTVAKWETGASMPRIAVLCRLAEVLGCSVDELLTEKR